MTTFYLVRHAAHDLVGIVFAGRTVDVALNAQGRRQAEALARQFAQERITQIISSRRKRARETAEPIAAAHALGVTVAPQIDEHDAGDWSGQTFESLQRDPHWGLWNERRGEVRPPAGESMRELQLRVLGYLDWLAARYPHDRIVLVTHAEPIRAAVLYEHGLALDAFLQIEVPLASVTMLSRAPAPSTAVERA